LLSPCAISNINRARRLRRCSVLPARAHLTKAARPSSLNTISAAFIATDYHILYLMQLDTRRCKIRQDGSRFLGSDEASANEFPMTKSPGMRIKVSLVPRVSVRAVWV
jgi:hypothetical protein